MHDVLRVGAGTVVIALIYAASLHVGLDFELRVIG